VKATPADLTIYFGWHGQRARHSLKLPQETCGHAARSRTGSNTARRAASLHWHDFVYCAFSDRALVAEELAVGTPAPAPSWTESCGRSCVAPAKEPLQFAALSPAHIGRRLAFAPGG
jgi:hypothetical protein